MIFAWGVSLGMKRYAGRPAWAAYAASAPAALPAEGTASFLAPRYLAIATATAIPRALKLPVGVCDSSLTQRRFRSHRAAIRGAVSSGVHPSPRAKISWPAGNGSISGYPQREAER